MISQNFANEVNSLFQNSNKESIRKLESHFYHRERKFDRTVDRNDWYVKGRKTRVLWTPKGDIKVTRRIYQNRVTGECQILFDKHIGLDPYWYIQSSFFPLIMVLVNKVYSYKKLSSMLNYEVSKWAIAKIMKEGKLYFKPRRLTTSVKELFVNVDGMFINRRRAKRYEVKFALAYTGTANKGKRTTLINKMLIPFSKDVKKDDMASILFRYLVAVYDKYEKIIFVGDGADWITTLARQFHNSTRYIDHFYYTKFIKDFLSRRIKVP